MAQGLGGAFTDGSPNGPRYGIEVNNKGSTNVGRFQAAANTGYENVYQMAHVYKQDGNTVCV